MDRVRILSTCFATLAIALHASAQQPTIPQTTVRAGRTTAANVADGARIVVNGRELVTSIQGNALTATNDPLTDAMIRLRDARFGRIINTTVTDKAGLFEFSAIQPGSYVVEIVGSDQTVLAASGILNINPGEAMSAILKLPFRIPPPAGVLGHAAPSAFAIATTAAAAGILGVTVTSDDSSPRR